MCSRNSTSTFINKSLNIYFYDPLIFNFLTFRVFLYDSQKTYTIKHTNNIVTSVPSKHHLKYPSFKDAMKYT
jgi:hypothetical protein